MADDVDRASELIEEQNLESLNKIRKAASNIPKGEPGECELCGEWSGRLVQGACAPCRDRYKLP